MVYQPSKEQYADPKRGHYKFETVEIPTSDGVKLSGWYFPAKVFRGKKSKGTFIQFHGNAQNMSSHFLSVFWVVEAGYDYLGFDYRGYGNSEGSPDQEGLIKDAQAVMEWIAQKKPSQTILWGQSLGGAVLARAFPTFSEETKKKVKLVILEGTFYSYKNISRRALSGFWLTWPFQWLGPLTVSDQESPETSFAQITPTPLLILHGQKDSIIPPDIGEKVFSLAQDPKDIWRLEESGHLDAMYINRGANREKLIQYVEAHPDAPGAVALGSSKRRK
jgi:fermentation-respiration switch protein FrsA (DUF1100 family)